MPRSTRLRPVDSDGWTAFAVPAVLLGFEGPAERVAFVGSVSLLRLEHSDEPHRSADSSTRLRLAASALALF